MKTSRKFFGWLMLATMTATSASAQPTMPSLLVSGQTSLAIIDTDNDGPDPQDCQFSALVGAVSGVNPQFASMMISSGQANAPLLRVCQMSFDATATKGADSSSNYVAANIFDAHGPIGFDYPDALPLIAELVDETSSPNINAPVKVNDGFDYGEVRDASTAQAVQCGLCSVGGNAAARVRGGGSPNMLVDLPLYPNSSSPTHLELPGPPAMFELAAGGMQAFNAYVPLTANRHLTLVRSDAPTVFLVDLDLASLPPCSNAAPTASGFGLILTALTLLAAGSYLLSRRQSFGRALSF